jgi:hypothetical protein
MDKDKRIAAAIAEAQRIKKKYSYEEKAIICLTWKSTTGVLITFNFGKCDPLKVGDMIDNDNGTKTEVVAIV